MKLYTYYECIRTESHYLFFKEVFHHENCTIYISAKASLSINDSPPPPSYLCKDYRLSVPSAKAAIKSLCGWHDFVKLLTVQDPFHVRTQFTSTQIFNLPADGFLRRREV